MRSNDGSVEHTLVAVGDIMLGDSAICVGFGFHSHYTKDASQAFADVAPLLQSGEIVLGNLECLLVNTGSGSTRYRRDQMRGDPQYASTLRSAGFTALSVANNHAMQHGRNAFEGTVETLRKAGIVCVGLRGDDGWCAEPITVTTRAGLRVGLLGYSWRPRQYDTSEAPYAEGDVDAAVSDVRRLRRTTDTVVVSLHWGEDFVQLPSVSEVNTAHRIIDAGATVIVGHHPHVVRPVERYARGLICYSLGNFVTDMLWQPELRRGGVLVCRLGRGEVSEIRVSSVRADDLYRPLRETAAVEILDVPTRGIAEAAYSAEAAHSVRRQRRSAYGFTARNTRRYPPSVLSQMLLTTLRNKIFALFRR